MFFLQLVPPGPLLRAPLLAGWQGGLELQAGSAGGPGGASGPPWGLGGSRRQRPLDPWHLQALTPSECLTAPPPIIAPSRPPVPVTVLLKRLLGSGDPLLPPLHPCSQGQSPAPRPPRSLSEQKWLLRLVGRAHSPCINWQTERGCHGRPARAPEDPGCEMEHHI